MHKNGIEDLNKIIHYCELEKKKLQSIKKKTSIGNGKFTKNKNPGAHGGNKGYKKKYRGQGKR